MTSTGEPGGPAVVALGGGHGLAATLAAVRGYAGELTAVVSVADDGGSSGRLRAELGLAAPGDLRRCVSALAGPNLLARSLEYRFHDGDLAGHPVGNLLLAGLTMASGDFQAAIDELCRLVEVDGTVIPATSVPVRLLADSDRGLLEGQVTIERAGSIRDLRFDPPDPPVSPRAVRAVLTADQVVIGPGSLFTSVLAAAMVPDLRRALQDTTAQRVFVANVANEKGLERGFGLAEHLATVAAHGIPIDVVVASLPAPEGTGADPRVRWFEMAAADRWGHDPERLGEALEAVWEEAGRAPTGRS
ncbi:MAG: uridine diphosphate-N-acetylglucosamine-binding protein YvcK [Acidimicrobiales bacterium]